MRKLERPPLYKSYIQYISDFVESGILHVHAALYKAGIIRQINDDYLYWNKVKYKVPATYKDVLTPVELWSVVKEDRLHNRRYFEIANEGFYVTNTDSLQQYLHQFDLSLGGSLGGPGAISEVDKHR